MSKKELPSLIDSFNDKENAFQLQTVTYENIEKCINMIRNDCSTRYDHIPASLIKTSFRILCLANNFYNKQFHQNKSIPRHMETR